MKYQYTYMQSVRGYKRTFDFGNVITALIALPLFWLFIVAVSVIGGSI